MSYTPTNWKAGDVVTSAKLNKMEQGIAASGGIRIVHLTMGDDNLLQLDITPNELTNAFENGEIVIIIDNLDGIKQYLLFRFLYTGIEFTVTIAENFPIFISSDPDEYFTYDLNSESSGDEIAGGEHAQ